MMWDPIITLTCGAASTQLAALDYLIGTYTCMALVKCVPLVTSIPAIISLCKMVGDAYWMLPAHRHVLACETVALQCQLVAQHILKVHAPDLVM